MVKYVFNRVEKHCGTGKNVGYQHFILFPIMFSKGLYCRITMCGNSLRFLLTGKDLENVLVVNSVTSVM